MIGRKLAHYEITALLGKGGMGEVYKARDTRLGRDVALKVLPEDWSDDQARVRRFEREAKALAALNHPNIAALFGFHNDEDIRFMAMELLPGTTLAADIPAAGYSLDRLLEIGIPLADAVAHAHDQGVIHRDLKPANVMFDASGRIRVLDFGLAGLLREKLESDAAETVEALTGEGTILGTSFYMAPEQVEGRVVDARADVFAMGVILYELATGCRPFQAGSAAGIASAVLRDDPAPLAQVRPELPADLARVIRRCLEKNSNRRIQTARDVCNELEDLRDGNNAKGLGPGPDPATYSGFLAEHHMTVTTDHVRQLSVSLPRMIGDSMTYLDNERDSDVLVICLHGIGNDQRAYEEFLRQATFRVVAPSLYGFGESARLRPALTYADHNLMMVAFVEELLRRVGPKKLILVGHSSGADQMLHILASEAGERLAPHGLVITGPAVEAGPGFVSGPYSLLTNDPDEILDTIRKVASVAETLDSWLRLNSYLVQAFTKFAEDTGALRMFAQGLIEMYDKDEFFGLFRTATDKVAHVRCVFSIDEADEADHALKRHISDNVLGSSFAGDMIVREPVGHVQLISAAVLLPHVEEIVRRVSAEDAK